MIYIMDASAMLAFLRDEAGADVIETYLLEPGSHSLAHSINLYEVFYDFVRAESEVQAQQAIADLLDIGVSERSDLDAAFWQEAGKLKAVHRRVSLANCLAMALTLRTGGSLVTSDHIVFLITVSAWITRSIRIPVFDRVASVPNGSAPVTHQDQGFGRMTPTENSARPWQSRLPQKTVGARPCPPVL